MAHFELPRVALGTALCSEGQEQGVLAPTPRSWAQPDSQLVYSPLLPQTHRPSPGRVSPSLHAAGIVTQLPLKLGKGVEGRVSCPDSFPPWASTNPSAEELGTRLPQHQPLVHPCLRFTSMTKPTHRTPHPVWLHPWNGHRLRSAGRKGALPVPPNMAPDTLSFLAFISLVSSSGCSILSPFSRKISIFML